MSAIASDDDDAEAYAASDLVAKFESLNAAFFASTAQTAVIDDDNQEEGIDGDDKEEGSHDDEEEGSDNNDDGEGDAQLHRAILSSLLYPTTVADGAWKIIWREGIGRILVASRSVPQDTLVFRERPLVAVEVTERSEALKGEMAAVAMELLKLPPDSPAKLLQEPCYLAAGPEDEDAKRSAASLREWSDSIFTSLSSREVKRDDGSRVDCTVDAVRWALGVATVNSHGGYDPTRGVLGILASMMQHECAPRTSPTAISLSRARSLSTISDSVCALYFACACAVSDSVGRSD